MGLATYQNPSGYTAIGMPPSFNGYLDQEESSKLRAFDSATATRFLSKVIIEGSNVFIPEQRFLIHQNNNEIEIKNIPTTAWPRISIHLISSEYRIQVESIDIAPSEATTDGEIKYTRFQWALSKFPNFALTLPDRRNLRFKFDLLSPDEINSLQRRALICRKLKFIEFAFNTKFFPSGRLNADDLKGIDFIYRALTEGEFSVRGDSISVLISKDDIDWTKAPFNEPGKFPQSLSWHNTNYSDGTESLFGKNLEVGDVLTKLDRAVYSGPSYLSIAGSQKSIGVRFDVLDHQISVRYEKYAKKGKKKLQEKLAQFKSLHLRDDPEELLKLMDESLISDVSKEEANLIAMGWLQYNRFPDRYCPQEPKFDEQKKAWKIPIFLVYANGEGDEVGELLVDSKTGKVISHAPIDEIRSNGKTLAEKIINARETTPVQAGD